MTREAGESSAADGVRLGPVTWVPGLRTTANDPWAHRKGEPRPLALLWSLYLMASALTTLLRVRSLTMPTTEQFAFGCRSMVLMTLIGVALLWPMVRLSQQFPARRGRALAADLLVMLAPVQAVVWPMGLLTHWSLEVTGALAASVGSWALFSAGMLAWAWREDSPAARCGWMLTIALAMVVAPSVLVWWPGAWSEGGRQLLMYSSPLTSAWAITGAPSGLAPAMQWWEWALIAVPGALGAALWLGGLRLALPRAAGYSVVGPGPQD